RSLKLRNTLHRSADAATRSRPAWPSDNALRQLAFTQAHRPRRSNPHRFSIPRFPPLEVFRRRPPEYRAITVSGRHPKTFTASDPGGPAPSWLSSRRRKLAFITRLLREPSRIGRATIAQDNATWKCTN